MKALGRSHDAVVDAEKMFFLATRKMRAAFSDLAMLLFRNDKDGK